MTVDELVIKVGLDPEGVKEGINRTASILDTGLKRIANVASTFLAPVAGALAASELFDTYVNGVAALDRLSESLDMDIERLQEWQGAARTAGVEADEIGNIFRDMNDYITDATRFDSGPLKEIAAQLGISLTDINGAARNSEAVLLDLADAFHALSAQEATGYGMQLSFDPGMIALLQQGRNALEELFREQRELGIYTKQDAEIAKTFNRELGDLWQSMKAGSAIVLRMVVPAMTKMIDWIERGVKFMREHETFVEAFFITLATAITAFALPALAKLAVAAATNPFTLLIAGAAGLALVLEDLYVWMNGGEAAFGDFWSNFGTPEEVKASVEGFIQSFKEILPAALSVAKVVGSVFGALWTLQGAFNLATIASKGIETIGKRMELLKNIGGAVVAVMRLLGFQMMRFAAYLISTVIPAVVSFTAALLANPITWVVAGIMALIAALYLLYKNWDTVKEGAQALWDALVSIFSGAVDWFKGVFDGIVDAIAGPFLAAFDKVKSGWNTLKGIFGFDEAAGTTGGLNYIGPLGGDAGQAISPAAVASSTSNYTSDTSVNIGKVEVQTQATDADGISRDIGKGLQNNMAKFTVNQGNTGVRQ